jgi:ribosome biogenesis protein Nip4
MSLNGLNYKQTKTKSLNGLNYTLSSTDTDTCIGIGRIRIRGYGNFIKNQIRGYVYYLKNKIKIIMQV